MSNQYLAAAVQLNSGLDINANLTAAAHWVVAAANEGAKLIALPELFVCYGDLAMTIKHAEPITGPLVWRFRTWATENSIWLLAGSFAELDSSTQKIYNTSLLLDPWGNIVARYRKRHLFDIHLTESVTSCESKFFAHGQRNTCVTTPCGTLGIGICFDLRFPEHFRDLSQQGSEVLLAPSAFTAKTGRDHWELLLKARAVENVSYIIAPNLAGIHSPTMQSYGHSMIVDPWGNILSLMRNTEEGIVLAQIDLEFLYEIRRQLPVLKMRRAQLQC
jgi:predicted amidohydrolase